MGKKRRLSMLGIEFIGNVSKCGELRVTQSGVNVYTFNVAVNNKYNKETPPTFFKVTAWRKQAESCSKYIQKGMKVYVHCSAIKVDTYDSNGETRTSIEVTADDVEFLSRAENNNSSAEDYNNAPEVPQTQGGYTDVSSAFSTEDLPF